jgi:predicted phage tail protein
VANAGVRRIRLHDGRNFGRTTATEAVNFINATSLPSATIEFVRSQFEQGEYQIAVFEAMRQVEIRVRTLCGADDMYGGQLFDHAFKANEGLLAPIIHEAA